MYWGVWAGACCVSRVHLLQLAFSWIAAGTTLLTLPTGMFVSESKFQEAPWDFIPHILSNPPNTAALEALITKPEVEARLLVRLANKARVYGCEMDADGRVVTAAHSQQTGGKIDIEQVVRLYRDWVIPLTKDVEVSGSGVIGGQGRRLGAVNRFAFS